MNSFVARKNNDFLPLTQKDDQGSLYRARYGNDLDGMGANYNDIHVYGPLLGWTHFRETFFGGTGDVRTEGHLQAAAAADCRGRLF
jgi:hypothetical protein